MKKIIYISWLPVDSDLIERMCFTSLDERFSEFEIWDISQIFGSESTARELDQIKNFATKSQIKGALSDLPEDSVIMLGVWLNKKSYWLYKEIRKHRFTYGLHSILGFPKISIESDESRLGSFVRRLRWAILRKGYLVEKLLSVLPAGVLRVKPYDFVLTSGNSPMVGTSNLYAKTTLNIMAHSYDYELVRFRENVDYDHKDSYLVFIDQYLPYHPDFNWFDVELGFEPEEYYVELSNALKAIEAEKGLPVKIALHPRTSEDFKLSLFGKRECIRNRTVDLVRNSSGVITHYSTAVSYAILYSKPIMLLKTPSIERSRYSKAAIASLCKELNIQSKSLGSDRYSTEFCTVDPEHSQTYLKNYVKSEKSQDKPLWTIFADALTD